MARTHPPSLVTRTLQSLDMHHLIEAGQPVLVAVSGGPDSMALLHVLAGLRAKRSFSLVAHGVDHCLRAAASAELDLAEDFARSLEVPFARTAVNVAPGANLQARARAARYAALEAAATSAGASRLATAHHATDRAETVLLRLLRGAGPAGLAVLPPRAGDRIRPFIASDAASIRAHVERHRIPFALDPSNENPAYLRTRVRSEVLPLLRTLSPTIDAHLCALADQLDASRAATPVSPEQAVPNACDRASGPRPTALARGTRDALEALARLANEKRRVLLPGGLVATYDRTQLRVVVRRGAKRPPHMVRDALGHDALSYEAADHEAADHGGRGPDDDDDDAERTQGEPNRPTHGATPETE